MGVLSILYFTFFSSGYIYAKFENKGKLLKYISETLIDKYKIKSGEINTYHASKVSAQEFFSVVISNGLPLEFSLDKNTTETELSRTEIATMFSRVEDNGKLINIQTINWTEKYKKEYLKTVPMYLNYKDAKDRYKCMFITEHIVTDVEYQNLKKYLIQQLPYIDYLQFSTSSIRVIEGVDSVEPARQNQDQILLWNPNPSEKGGNPMIILSSPLNADKIAMYPEHAANMTLAYLAMKTANYVTPLYDHFLKENSCLYIPPFWWYQIAWNTNYKLIEYSFPAPSQLKYIFQ